MSINLSNFKKCIILLKNDKMKTTLIIAAILFCTLSSAQDTTVINTEPDTSSFYMIKLLDNTMLSGKIVEQNNSEINFLDVTIGKVTIPVNKIQKIMKLSGNQYCVLKTNDGKEFSGLIISQNGTEITIKTESLGLITIANSKIREVKLAEKEQFVGGKYFFPNPHPTRYFFGPSAIPLDKSEGYYQNAYVLANSFQIGVSDHFSMGGGTVIPFMFFITPKIGYKVGKNVYVGGGVLFGTTISSDFSFGLGAVYGSLTLGNKENNFTIDAGYGFMKDEIYNSQTNDFEYEWGFAQRPMFSLSASLRLAPKVSLITENWIFATKDYDNDPYTYDESYKYKYRSVLSFGFRLMGERNAFDIAVAIPSIDGGTFGIPYLDYVFKF